MDKSRLWLQTEESFLFLKVLRLGTLDEKELAASSLSDMIPKIRSPLLRARVTTAVTQYKNARILAAS